MPNPPICMSSIMTVFPKRVKQLFVFTTANPVTHTALVEVNKASMGAIPLEVEGGSMSRTVPSTINRKKLKIKIRVGLDLK